MNDKIKKSFLTCVSNDCLEITNSPELHINDPTESKCQILSSEEIHLSNFHIINQNRKDLSFLSIDKCVFNDNSHKKCDFAIFDEKTFCFVEIKDTDKRCTVHKRKSISQLKTTITKFISCIDFSGYDIEAIISWRYRPFRPASSTLMQSSKLDFSLSLNTKLLEGNQKEFN